MEEAIRTRTAAREAVRDITPPHLRDLIDDLLVERSMLPGVLVLLSARTGDADPADVDGRAAGTQLIYQGLALTRRLARTDPWAGAPADDDREMRADVQILAADAMVARGFSLLAHTEAADKAVETVRAFGRAETERETDAQRGANALERDVFTLAIIAGTTAAGVEPTSALRRYAADLADTVGEPPLPEADAAETKPVQSVIAQLTGGHGATNVADERAWQSSATDP